MAGRKGSGGITTIPFHPYGRCERPPSGRFQGEICGWRTALRRWV